MVSMSDGNQPDKNETEAIAENHYEVIGPATVLTPADYEIPVHQ